MIGAILFIEPVHIINMHTILWYHYCMKAIARLKAESLRRQGMSIKEIAQKVDASPSTVSRWCSSIVLTQSQQNILDTKRRIAGAKALAPWIRRNRDMKRDDIKNQGQRGQHDISKVTKRDLFILGLGLYWGEGYKRGSQECGFTNSDAGIIRTILTWFNECYAIPTKDIIARLTINERYKSQTERLTKMWSKETGIHLSQFGKPAFISGYNGSKLEDRTYRGTLRIKVRRGTSLRRRILASIAEAKNQIALNSRKTAP